MFNLLLTTKPFMDEVANLELKNFFKLKYTQIDVDFFEITFKNEKELVETSLNIIHNSRCFEHIYLEIGRGVDENSIQTNDNLISSFSKLKKFNLEDEEINSKTLKLISKTIQSQFNLTQDNLDYDIKFEIFDEEEDGYIIVLDLAGFNLTKRNYKLREYEDSLNPLVVNFCMYNLTKNKNYDSLKILDPFCQIGDIIIESSLFLPRSPLNLNNRRELPISKIFKLPFGIPQIQKSKNKLVGVASDSTSFKYIKENITHSKSKITLTSFDFDWMDVKYHRNDFDFVICEFPHFEEKEEKEEFEKEFFYQSEFVAKQSICVITSQEIEKKYLNEFKLKIEKVFEIEDEEFDHLIYIIGHN